MNLKNLKGTKTSRCDIRICVPKKLLKDVPPFFYIDIDMDSIKAREKYKKGECKNEPI